MGKLTKEDIILFFLEDPDKLAGEIWEGNVPKSDEIRILLCELGNARCAYYYAYYVDKEHTDEIKKVACKDPWYASCYKEFLKNKESPLFCLSNSLNSHLKKLIDTPLKT